MLKLTAIRNIIILLFVVSLAVPVKADDSENNSILLSPFLYLNYVNSARAKAMGDAVVNIVDEQSALYNPGAYGLFYMDKVFAFNFPNNTKHAPEIADDLRMKTWSIGAGINSRLLGLEKWLPFEFSFGLGYSNHRFEYGIITRTDELGNPLGEFEPYSEGKIVTLSGGIDYYLRFGFGYNLKKLSHEFVELGPGMFQGTNISEATATDYGLIIQLPIHEFLSLELSPDKSTKLELTPAFAFSKTNIADFIYLIDSSVPDELPETKKTGLSLETAVVRNEIKQLSLVFVYETEQILELDKIKKYGIEAGFFNALFFRIGDSDGSRTYGFGANLRGFVDSFFPISSSDYNNPIRYLINHLDLSFDYATITDEVHAFDGAKVLKLNLSF